MPGYFAKNEQHRRLVLRALLWITLGGGLFFSVVNLLHENWLLAGLEIAYAGVSLYLLSILERTRYLQLLTAIYLLPFFSIMIVALAQTHTTFAVFAWIQTIPIICYLLLGLRLGLYVSVLFDRARRRPSSAPAAAAWRHRHDRAVPRPAAGSPKA